MAGYDNSVTSDGTSSGVWQGWTSGSTTTATFDGSDTAWFGWNTQTCATGDYWGRSMRDLSESDHFPKATPARKISAETTETREQAMKKLADAMKERNEIKARAKDLLISVLSPEQQKQLDKLTGFVVEAEERRFFIEAKGGTSGNVKELDQNDRIVSSFCIHTRMSDNIPHDDLYAAQKLLIEHDLTQFLKIANKTDCTIPRQLQL